MNHVLSHNDLSFWSYTTILHSFFPHNTIDVWTYTMILHCFSHNTIVCWTYTMVLHCFSPNNILVYGYSVMFFCCLFMIIQFLFLDHGAFCGCFSHNTLIFGHNTLVFGHVPWFSTAFLHVYLATVHTMVVFHIIL